MFFFFKKHRYQNESGHLCWKMLIELAKIESIDSLHLIYEGFSLKTWIHVVNNCLFVCLFVCLGLYVPLENFSIAETSKLPMKGCKCLTYTRHSWSLSSEVLKRNMGHPFILVIQLLDFHFTTMVYLYNEFVS